VAFTFSRQLGKESEELPRSWAKEEEESGSSFFYKELVFSPEYQCDKGEAKFRDVDASSTLGGFEYFRIFSGDYGDWLTTDLQVRLLMGPRKRFLRNAYANFNLNFDYDQDKLEHILTSQMMFSYEIHNAYANFKLNSGRSNIKVGHFDVPFGLEPLIDTHPTLLQTQAMKNIGFKKDWGISVNGSLPSFDYELSYTLGCGGNTKIWRKDGSYLLSGRIGTPTSKNIQYGLSLLHGEVLPALYDDYLFQRTITRKRIGLDSQLLYRSYTFKGELAYGKDRDRDVLSTLLEMDYILPHHQKWQLESQIKAFINDLSKSKTDDTTMTLGVSYQLSNSITLRTNYIHDFNLRLGNEEDILAFQLYYYGQ